MKSRLTSLLPLLMLLLTAACAPGRNDSSRFTTLPVRGWCYGDTLTFYPHIADSTATGVLSVAVRHSNAYPFADLYLEVTSADAGRVRRDTVRMTLADSYGRWLGSGFGDSYQCEATVCHTRLTDSLPVKVRQIMRVDTLRGIEQAGIIFHGDERQ